MIRNYDATPQIFITGRIIKAEDFDLKEMFVKYKFVYGPNFILIDGKDSGETFQNVSYDMETYVAFDHPINLNLKCRSIKGWPKLYIEAWGTDGDGKNMLQGYNTVFIPFYNGQVKLTCNTWRPDNGYLKSKLLGVTPQFKHTQFVYSSEEKFEVDSVSSGSIIIELDIILKDFELHGIE